MRRRTSGGGAPGATGTSARLAISIRRSALGKVSESGTLPQTGVMASTFSSGERRARKMAMASSTPGSVSRMMRRDELAGLPDVGIEGSDEGWAEAKFGKEP